MKLKKNQSGFAHLVLVAGVVLAIGVTGSAVLVQANRGASQAAQAQQQAQTYRQLSEERKAAAQERVTEIKAEVEERRAQIKQDVCERQQARLEAVAPRLSTNATTMLNTFNSIYTNVQGFYADGQLTANNYEELKGAVDAAQSNATASVDAIGATQPQVDCENPELGGQLLLVSEATRAARSSLLAYRSALTDLISALKAVASEEAEKNADNENNNNGGDEDSESDSDTDTEN